MFSLTNLNKGVDMKGLQFTAAVLLLGVLGCGGGDETADETVSDSVATPAPAPSALSDAEIAHVAVTANTIDIEAGELAKEKSQNAEVKAFAQTMITDHTGVNDEATKLVTKLGVTPADNGTSQSLKSDADQVKANLSTKAGAEFDREYMAREVAYHQAVLDALDRTLIPGAQNAELKALLEKVRPAVAAHHQMAQALQAKLPAQ